MDRIEPIGPRLTQPSPIPAVRRPDRSTDERERERQQRQRKRRATLPDLPPPPDDGRPHVDVRV